MLRELSFTAMPGKTVALVGSSGCGKSTILNLIDRFYNPVEGAISLDGEDISAYNIQWLRKRIGVVTQQPLLMPTTVFANIAFWMEVCTNPFPFL